MVNYSLDARHSLPLRRRISPPRNLDFPYPLLVHIADPSFSDCYVHDMRIPYMRENDRWRPRCFFFSLLLTAKSCMLGPAGWHLCAMTPSWWPRHCGLWAVGCGLGRTPKPSASAITKPKATTARYSVSTATVASGTRYVSLRMRGSGQADVWARCMELAFGNKNKKPQERGNWSLRSIDNGLWVVS